MPIARGLGQFARVNLLHTYPQFSSFYPVSRVAFCGTPVSISVLVKYGPGEMQYVNGGDFDIVETLSNTVIASGTLNSLGAATVGPITNLPSYSQLQIQYKGKPNTYYSSESALYNYIITPNQTETDIIYPVSEQYYCYTQTLNCLAQVTSLSGAIPTGNVNIILRQSSGDVSFGNYPIGGTGYVSFIMPENSGVDGERAELIFNYLGDGCFLPSSKLAYRLLPISHDTVTATLTLLSEGSSYIYGQIISLKASLSSSFMDPPTTGQIEFKAYKVSSSVVVTIATLSPNSSGEAFASTTTLDPGSWQLKAIYTPPSGSCYQPDESNVIAISIIAPPA